MILFSHPTGNANVREASRALNEAGLLSEFWTSVCWNQKHFLNRVLPLSVSAELGRRSFPHVEQRLRCHPWREMGRLAARQLNISHPVRHEVGVFSTEAVWRSLDLRVTARLSKVPHITGVYAYEDGALATFREARRRGVKTIYDLPIGYWKFYRELVEQERELRPEWTPTLQGNLDSAEKLRRKDEELALADHIVVASKFVRNTLLKAEDLHAPISVVPYGAPPICAHKRKTSANHDKLRLIYVGALTQRKGISYLLEAARQLGSSVSLTVIGRRVAECPALDLLLEGHRWIPSLPHAAVLEELCNHDVMVFPSLFEGFGLVILEAMSHGVPVITTPHTAGPDFIDDGDDGFIIPIRDAGAIVEKLELLIADRGRLLKMSEAARFKAAKQSWEEYRRQVAAIVSQTLQDTAVAISDLPSEQLCTSS